MIITINVRVVARIAVSSMSSQAASRPTPPQWRRSAASGQQQNIARPLSFGRFTDISEIAFVAHCNGCFLSASADNRVFASFGVLQEPERITVISVRQGADPLYALMTSKARLIAVHDGLVTCQDDSVSIAAAFQLVSTGDGRFWIRQGDENYLTLRADCTVIVGHDPENEASTWWPIQDLTVGMCMRTYAVHQMHNQKVALWLPAAKGWMTANPLSTFSLSGGEVTSRAQRLLFWEEFTLLVMDRDKSEVALLTAHKTFISAQPSGKLSADKKDVGVWERFTLLEDDGGRVALRSAHGGFASAREERMDAKPSVAGPNELFMLLAFDIAKRRYWEKSPLVIETLQGASTGGPSGGGGSGGVNGRSAPAARPVPSAALNSGPQRQGTIPSHTADTRGTAAHATENAAESAQPQPVSAAGRFRSAFSSFLRPPEPGTAAGNTAAASGPASSYTNESPP